MCKYLESFNQFDVYEHGVSVGSAPVAWPACFSRVGCARVCVCVSAEHARARVRQGSRVPLPPLHNPPTHPEGARTRGGRQMRTWVLRAGLFAAHLTTTISAIASSPLWKAAESPKDQLTTTKKDFTFLSFVWITPSLYSLVTYSFGYLP